LDAIYVFIIHTYRWAPGATVREGPVSQHIDRMRGRRCSLIYIIVKILCRMVE
jgi:hypothetical protein